MMHTSLFELFKIGIGPSSSHTVGPMRASLRFVRDLAARGEFGAAIKVDLYGSLALTGIGHGTDRAVMMGLLEQSPDTVDLDAIGGRIETLRATGALRLLGEHAVRFDPAVDLRFHREQMYPDAGVVTHPNGMRFSSLDASGKVLFEQVYYSVGGGFILSAEELASADGGAKKRDVPYMFSSADELLRVGEAHGLSIAEMVLANEVALLADPTIVRRIDRIVSPLRPGNKTTQVEATLTGEARVKAAIFTLWQAMSDCIERGCAAAGTGAGAAIGCDG
jgi:L-serine dehydratase